jgi:hypothetical protein
MTGSDKEEISTIPSEDSGTYGWESAVRYGSLAVILLLVLAGLTGFLGVRTTSATASGDGLSLTVDHASITRPGLATPFSLVVESTDGSPLPPSLTTRVDSAYLAMFDENGLDPEPTSSFQSEEWTWWEFEVPDGAAVLEVSFDARLEPAVQSGRSATAAVEVNGTEATAVDFTTWVLP